MSEGLAQQLANEWEFKVREYKKAHPKKNPFGLMLQLMIRDGIYKSEGSDTVKFEGNYYQTTSAAWNHNDTAKRVVEILKERIGE